MVRACVGFAVAAVAVLLGAGVGHAQPGTEPPQRDAGYPAEVSARPLVLPRGMFEGTAILIHSWYAGELGGDFSWTSLFLGMRAGVGSVELSGEALMRMDQAEGYESDTLERVGGMVRIPTRAGQAVELRGAMWGPTNEVSTLEVEAGYAVRQQTSANAAVFGGGGLHYRRTTASAVPSYYVASLHGRIGAAIQLAPQLATEIDCSLTLPVSHDFENYNPPATTGLGARFIYTSRPLDVFAGARMESVGSGVNTRTLLLGVAGRIP